jgi:hypothetical protein
MKQFMLGVIVGSVIVGSVAVAQNNDIYGRPQWGKQITPQRDAYGRPNFPEQHGLKKHDPC